MKRSKEVKGSDRGPSLIWEYVVRTGKTDKSGKPELKTVRETVFWFYTSKDEKRRLMEWTKWKLDESEELEDKQSGSENPGPFWDGRGHPDFGKKFTAQLAAEEDAKHKSWSAETKAAKRGDTEPLRQRLLGMRRHEPGMPDLGPYLTKLKMPRGSHRIQKPRRSPRGRRQFYKVGRRPAELTLRN